MVIEHFKKFVGGDWGVSYQQRQASGRVSEAAVHATQTAAWRHSLLQKFVKSRPRFNTVQYGKHSIIYLEPCIWSILSQADRANLSFKKVL